tara:strand:+ start:58368 stop:58940 length:573 start_codon:yes stop_codon:yes gene_type:complete
MFKNKHIVKSVMTILCVITLFACEGTYGSKKQLSMTDGAPSGEGKNVNLKYTDSGKVVTNLIAPVLWDYSNVEFPYREFPEGVEVHFWKDGEESTVRSDYAVQYDNTSIIDLRKNVVLVTSDSVELRAEQLYWDQDNKWIFSDRPFQIKFKDGSYNDGARFDSSEDFTTFLSRKNQGVQIIEAKENTDGE